MSSTKFVVLTLVALGHQGPDGTVGVRWHPKIERVKACGNPPNLEKAFGSVDDVEYYELIDPNRLITWDLIYKYVEITTANGRIANGAIITSATAYVD